MAFKKDRFDSFDLIFALFAVVILGAAVTFTGVFVWAVIQVVNHFTT